MHTPHVLSGGRYPVLRALAIIYVIVAALSAVSTVIGIGYALLRADLPVTDRLIAAMGALVAGAFMVLTMLAIAEVLKLFIDLEHNTRMAVPGRIGMPASVTTPDVVVTTTSADGAAMAHVNRINQLDEETAEAALLRGH